VAFSKKKSRKCPVCVGCTPAKVDEINVALAPLLAEVKASGEVPKARDSRFDSVSHRVGIAPHSLRYHLKECMLDLEIQDQRFQEFKSITDALSTANQEYMGNPTMQNSTAYTQLLTQWRALAEDIEGQTDPEVTVEFIVDKVLNSLSRQMLAAAAEELRSLRTQLDPLVDRNHKAFIDSQLKSSLSRISAVLRDSLNESLKSLCEYYKVELEAKARMRALDQGVDSTEPSLMSGSKSSEADAIVH